MKTLNLLKLSVLILVLLVSTEETQAQKKELISLEINVTNLKQDSGMVLLSLISEDKKTLRNVEIPADKETVTTKIEGLAKGKYAIRMFHDENRNSIMDNNQFGIPKEGYGFSNNPHAQFGPPADEKLLFNAEENTTIEVKMRYYW